MRLQQKEARKHKMVGTGLQQEKESVRIMWYATTTGRSERA